VVNLLPIVTGSTWSAVPMLRGDEDVILRFRKMKKLK